MIYWLPHKDFPHPTRVLVLLCPHALQIKNVCKYAHYPCTVPDIGNGLVCSLNKSGTSFTSLLQWVPFIELNNKKNRNCWWFNYSSSLHCNTIHTSPKSPATILELIRNIIYHLYIPVSALLLQKGKLPDHSPVARHVLCELPTSLKPLLQLYVTTDPSVVPNTRLLPKKGVPGSSHSAVAACVGDE